MHTKPVELSVVDGLVELVLEGGEPMDGDYRPRIAIRLPHDLNPNATVAEVRRMILTWAARELDAHLS